MEKKRYAVTREYYDINGNWMCTPHDAYNFKVDGLSKVARFLRGMDKNRIKLEPEIYKNVGYIDYVYAKNMFLEDETIGCYGRSLKVNGRKGE